MILEKSQIDKALQVWKQYKLEGDKYRNANKMTSSLEIDSQRQRTIPFILDLIAKYSDNELPLDDFKSSVDSINKKQRLWGFKGIKGMMFFNMLTNLSVTENKKTDFEAILKDVIIAPRDIEAATAKITALRVFAEELGSYQRDRRTSPKIGSIPYFLSYFWQIQKPEIYPVYYTSVINDLSDLAIWKPTGKVESDYQNYFELMYALKDLISIEEKKKISFWDIEHAFWFHGQVSNPGGATSPAASSPESGTERKLEQTISGPLSESYIPPIVSIIPGLASNDPELAKLCEKAGTSIENVFEDRLAILFRMLGYAVEELGQGQGRVPDGIATNQEYHYAIIFDAKVRQAGYTMGTDERAVREYILTASDKLRKQGFRNVYFMIISSKFSGDHDAVIRSLKMGTDVREVLLVEADAIIELLEEKLRDPELSLGPDGFQTLLASSGIITTSEIRDLVG